MKILTARGRGDGGTQSAGIRDVVIERLAMGSATFSFAFRLSPESRRTLGELFTRGDGHNGLDSGLGAGTLARSVTGPVVQVYAHPG
jgi:hypothetical protein